MPTYQMIRTASNGELPLRFLLPVFEGDTPFAKSLNAHLTHIREGFSAFYAKQAAFSGASVLATVLLSDDQFVSFYLDAYLQSHYETVGFCRQGEIWSVPHAVLLPCKPPHHGWYTDGSRCYLYRNTFDPEERIHRRRPAQSVTLQIQPFSAAALGRI